MAGFYSAVDTETPFAGLLKALDGSMGEWRPGAGSLRVVLFTDAEAKDGDLAAVVAKYAASIGATVTTGRSEGSLFGTKDSFALSYGVGGAEDPDHDRSFSPVSDPLTRPGPASLEVYTINTGGSHLDFSELQDLSKETGGGYFRPENTAEFVEYIKNVIEAPAEEYHVYRFFNAHNGSHFYTSNPEERDFIIANLSGYSYEGEAFTSSEDATTGEAVHRFFNTQLGYHFYTINSDEAESVKKNLPGFAYEGIAYYAEDEASGGKQALYRFYNEDVGNHFYTASEEERDAIEVNLPQYRYEGVAYYVDVA